MLRAWVLGVVLQLAAGLDSNPPGMTAFLQLGDLETEMLHNSEEAFIQAIGTAIGINDDQVHVLSVQSSDSDGLPSLKVGFQAEMNCDTDKEATIQALPRRLDEAIQEGTLWQSLHEADLPVSWVELEGTPKMNTCMPFIQLEEPKNVISEIATHVECHYNGHHVRVHHKNPEDNRSFFCKRASTEHFKSGNDGCVCKVWKMGKIIKPSEPINLILKTPSPTLPPTIAPTKGPVDCQTEEWSEWTVCSKSCGGGSQYQSRNVLIYPAYGGKDCPHLLDVRQCNSFECVTPTSAPTLSPPTPTSSPSASPTLEDWWNMDENAIPTSAPTAKAMWPIDKPTDAPSSSPTFAPTTTSSPTAAPTKITSSPTVAPTLLPTVQITLEPTSSPSSSPTTIPTAFEEYAEFEEETLHPPSPMPTKQLTPSPSFAPTSTPAPTQQPSAQPTQQPSASPTVNPTQNPSASPTTLPTAMPTENPTTSPTVMPTYGVTKICSCTGTAPCQSEAGTCYPIDPATDTCPRTSVKCECPCSAAAPCAGNGGCRVTQDLFGAQVCPPSTVHCKPQTQLLQVPEVAETCTCGLSKPCQHIGGRTCFASQGDNCPEGTQKCACNCAGSMPCLTADHQCAPTQDLFGAQICPPATTHCALE